MKVISSWTVALAWVLAAPCVFVTAADQAAAQAPAQAPDLSGARVVPIQVTGDPAARFAMVIMGDGYTQDEMPRFRAHLDKHLNVLWSIEPFRSYRNYINVYAVEIASQESGITCDPEIRQRKNTPLGLEFGGGCTNINARGITPAQGRADLIRKYAALATPNFDQILIIANTDTYGGIGGSLATTSGGNSLGPLITPHELGHSLGRLTDEYTYSQRGVAGGAYTGTEPPSIHMTIMPIEDMLTKQAKWFRWLGEPSESGGKIERFEGGSQRTTGIFRPSKHSMMISVGYYFDQVSRERMVHRISEQVKLIAAASPAERTSAKTDTLWIETPQPVYHELTVTWAVNGKPVGTGAAGGGAINAAARNPRHFSLREHKVAAGDTVTVTVVDPTTFVRDPEIRAKALTATQSWAVAADSGGMEGPPVTFTASTQNDRPIGRADVVYVATSNPRDRVLGVSWSLNGKLVPEANSQRTFPLAPRKLAAGKHTLAATVSDPASGDRPADTRTWTIDATEPTVAATIATPLASAEGAEPHYFIRDEFTMKLDPSDDQPGYVVAEFRVNGDGWHHYYGWPDAPPGTPYKFTSRGTTIKELVYGSLASEGLSPQPWEKREPGWGTHRIEYRGIDAAGNIGTARAYRVTFQPAPKCAQTISGSHAGNLAVSADTTCLAPGATVNGNVTVAAGASLVATNARVTGSVTATGASVVELIGTTVGGAVRVTSATGRVVVFASTITGALAATVTTPAPPAVLVGNKIGK